MNYIPIYLWTTYLSTIYYILSTIYLSIYLSIYISIYEITVKWSIYITTLLKQISYQ